MNSEKAIVKGFSIKPEQLKKLAEVIDFTRHGQFSQFVQDAIEEKLSRISQNKTEENKLAS